MSADAVVSVEVKMKELLNYIFSSIKFYNLTPGLHSEVMYEFARRVSWYPTEEAFKNRHKKTKSISYSVFGESEDDDFPTENRSSRFRCEKF